MEELGFGKLNRIREIQVPYEEKQQLFQLAADIMLAGQAEIHKIPDENGNVYLDINMLSANYRALEIKTKQDVKKWAELRNLGVSEAVLFFLPERTFKSNTYSDQINLEVHYMDKSPADLFAMKLSSIDSERVMMGNRREMLDMEVGWLEISREDANKVNNVLAVINETFNPRLAAP